jgi:hypothetical protein
MMESEPDAMATGSINPTRLCRSTQRYAPGLPSTRSRLFREVVPRPRPSLGIVKAPGAGKPEPYRYVLRQSRHDVSLPDICKFT